MQETLEFEKVLDNLPLVLTKNKVYFVKKPGGVEIYISNKEGTAAFKVDDGHPKIGMFEFTQTTPKNIWVIPHNWGTFCINCNVFDSSPKRELIIPDKVELTDINTVTISFSTPQAGAANLVLSNAQTPFPEPISNIEIILPLSGLIYLETVNLIFNIDNYQTGDTIQIYRNDIWLAAGFPLQAEANNFEYVDTLMESGSFKYTAHLKRNGLNGCFSNEVLVIYDSNIPTPSITGILTS